MNNPFDHWRETLDSHEQTSPPIEEAGDSLLPPTFQFSQNNLQDYVDCPRRFQLRHVLGQRWPAAQTEPIAEHEHYMEQGTQFHLLVERHLIGIPEDLLVPDDDLLRKWWDNYLATPPPDLPQTKQLPEIGIGSTLNGMRMTARIDLLAIDPGERAVIVDWKTSRRPPPRDRLAARLQSRIYPFILVEAGSHHFEGEIAPEQVSQIYWFAEDPTRPQIFDYSQAQYEEDRRYLGGLIDEVMSQPEGDWPLTDEVRQCKFCVYRSLCDRGVEAGMIDDLVDEVTGDGFNFDLDDIEEVAF